MSAAATAFVLAGYTAAIIQSFSSSLARSNEDVEMPIYAERLPLHTLIGEPESCPQLMECFTRPQTLPRCGAIRPPDRAVRQAQDFILPTVTPPDGLYPVARMAP